jgi:hypothetical protein
MLFTFGATLNFFNNSRLQDIYEFPLQYKYDEHVLIY